MTTVSLANGVIQTSLVLGSALLLAWVLRRRSAALRHAIIAAGVVCACAAPLIRPLVPAWDIKPVSGVIVLETSSAEPAAGFIAPSPVSPASTDWRATDVVFAVWASGAALCFLLLGAGLVRLRQLRVAGTPLSFSQWRDDVHKDTAAIGLRRHVTVVESRHPAFVATWGVFRPVVVVPSSARDWSPERFRLVLAHEFAHIKRRDWVVHMTAAILQAMCWFNPLTWLASRELRRLCEQACDDVVLGLGVDESEYAGHLIDLARVNTSRGESMFAPAEAMARRSSLEGRVRAMLDPKLNRRPLGTVAWIVIAVALVALAVPAAAIGVFGQGGPGSLSGTLRDPDGRPVPNAPVTLSQSGSATVQKAQTDAAGAFVFTALPAGDYVFDPAIPGFMKRYPITVRAGQRSQTDVTLRLGTVTEEINVASKKGEPAPPPAPRRAPPPPPPAYDPAADPCRKPGVSACVKPPIKTLDVRPIVPAGREGEAAIVVIEGEIGVGGTIEGARVTKVGRIEPPAGEAIDAPFGTAALDAVTQWKFLPTRLNGNPVKTTIVVTIKFTAIR